MLKKQVMSILFIGCILLGASSQGFALESKSQFYSTEYKYSANTKKIAIDSNFNLGKKRYNVATTTPSAQLFQIFVGQQPLKGFNPMKYEYTDVEISYEEYNLLNGDCSSLISGMDFMGKTFHAVHDPALYAEKITVMQSGREDRTYMIYTKVNNLSLNSIKLDGVSLDGFDKYVTSFSKSFSTESTTVPKLTVTTDNPLATTEVVGNGSFPGIYTYTITVSYEGEKRVYLVTLLTKGQGSDTSSGGRSGGGGSSSSSKQSESKNNLTENIKTLNTFMIPRNLVKNFKIPQNIQIFDIEGSLNEFKDLKTHWARESILEATKRGIMNGVSKDLFAPAASLTVEQTFAGLNNVFMINNILEMKINRDIVEKHLSELIKTPTWSTWASAQVLGNTNEELLEKVAKNPSILKAEMTRQDMAELIYILLKDIFPNNTDDAESFCKEIGFMIGDNDGTFAGERVLKRAELASILLRIDDKLSKV